MGREVNQIYEGRQVLIYYNIAEQYSSRQRYTKYEKKKKCFIKLANIIRCLLIKYELLITQEIFIYE